MNTRPLSTADDRACGFERLEETDTPGRAQSFMCNRAASVVWLPLVADPTTTIPLCGSCRRWLETMESLGLKVA